VLPLVVDVSGGPTGLVFNGSTNFVVSNGTASGPSLFLFATEGGTINGWNPSVPPPSPSTHSFVVADESGQGASYKGLAIASTAAGDMLYAADFHNAKVDAFDASFNPLPLGFADPNIPKGWAPFGIQALNGNIFVTYAKQDAQGTTPVPGGGQGYVDEFTPDGKLVTRVASAGSSNAPLNAPWGLAMAPSNFGAYSGDLLVGNFGNGRISAYLEQSSGKWVYKGQVRSANGTPVVLDGLWAIAFGNGASSGPTNNLYFAAGPAAQTHGLFGFIGVG
jgi:uncharacterized protein (TIGR03118 family)